MSVRLVKRQSRKGEAREFFMVDVFVEHPDGRTERVRKVSPEQTRRGAERYERELRQQMLQGTRIDPTERKQSEAPRFEAFAQEFLTKYAATTNKHSEQEAKESILRCHLTPAFGAKRLDEISTLDVDAYKAEKLAGKLSPKTINNHLTVLGRALRVAVEWGKLKSLPTIRWLKAPRPEFDFVTFEEAPRLLAAGDPGQWRTMILLGLRAGLRQGEMLALRWQDVDLVNGRVMVRRRVHRGRISTPKGGRSREVPLGEELASALAALQRHGGELVFSDDEGKMLTKGKCKWPLWRACKVAGLRRIGWHVLRHTFASHLAMRGVALKAIQELLGHATIEMTMRYAHLSPHVGRDAVRLLDSGSGDQTAPGGTGGQGAGGHGTATRHGNLMATRAEDDEK